MASRPNHPADLLFVNGHVLTLDPHRPVASAVAVRAGRVVSVGDDPDIRALAGATTRVIDLGDERALVPGLTDTHYHLVYAGMTASWLDFHGSPDASDMTNLVALKAATLPPGAWIYGRGWDPSNLTNSRVPTLTELDTVAPRHPVLLSRADGHVCLANSETLRRAGVTASTVDPPGGIIGRDPTNGNPDGVLHEAALYLAWNVMMAELTPADFRQPVIDGAMAAARAGVTMAHAMLLENIQAEVEAIRALDASGDLPIRLYLLVPVEAMAELPENLFTWRGRLARIGGVKVFADGTLFAGTAALRQPYLDRPSSYGAMSLSPEQLFRYVTTARERGLQPAVHAVGDRAVEAVLDAYAAVYGFNGVRAVRPRIEHATLLSVDLVRRAAMMGVVLSLQGGRQRRPIAEKVGRLRMRWINPWLALRDAGVMAVASSDAPFVQREPGPMAAVAEAVSRGLTLDDALAMATRNAAYASFDEDDLGMIRPGMLADFTVLSADPRLPAAERGNLSGTEAARAASQRLSSVVPAM
ncbi:MAG: amidohydrolase, partial [Chloroflexi bacterium]|nr:amidohydrolase [Chloroflexota bacterium]